MPTIEQTGEMGDHAVHMTLTDLLCTRGLPIHQNESDVSRAIRQAHHRAR